MILAVAYNHKDCFQALKLLSWVAFLSERAGGVMREVTLLVVPSRHAAQKQVHEQIQDLRDYFGKIVIHVPTGEHEVGWPGAANFMFKEALEYATGKLNDDMFWLEPDAIPIHPQWWTTIQDEWREAIAERHFFMGAEVLTGWRHMSGVGVYAQEWRTMAPSLVDVPDNSCWDLHAADDVVPRCQFTPLIQHIFHNPVIKDKRILSPDAVVFHQDKQGRLIEILAQDYGPAAAEVFSRPPSEPVMSTRYFYTANSSKLIESQGIEFSFESIGVFGGVHRGVYATDKESEIIALSALDANEKSPVKEITAERYDELTKKKAPRSRNSTPSPVVLPPLASQDRAARVADPVRLPKPVEPPKQPALPASLEEVLKFDTVRPAEPILHVRPNRKPRGRGK